ncbi:MAG TPA: GNAT family N-acetyltransferase [Rudaea sp.]
MQIQLRIATQEDIDFAFRVERETMEAHAIATWGTWRKDEARAQCVANILAGLTQVIEWNSTPVGVVRVERTDSSIELHQIYILSEFQRSGIGRHVLHRLMREADAEQRPIRLRVLKVNPAVHFYERLGFVRAGSDATHVYMVYVR